MLNPELKYILAKFHWDGYRMGSLEGYFITTPAKLEATKALPDVWFHDVLGKHSEVRVKFSEAGTLTAVSEDQAFIAEAARVFGVNVETGYLMGFNPFRDIWDGRWDDGDEGIPVPWFPLNAPDPVA